MDNGDDLRELTGAVLEGYHPQSVVVAGCALLITMMKECCLPEGEIQTVALNLKNFLSKKHIPNEEVNAITLSSYDDLDKWETIKEQFRVAVNNSIRESWDSKHLQKWSVEDTLRWLSDNELGQYCSSFKENYMDGQNMMDLNETDLRDLGISSLGHRKSFMRHLAEAKRFTYSAKAGDSHFTTLLPQNHCVSPWENEIVQSEKQTYSSVIILGLPESFLEDENALFNIGNLAFTGFLLDSYLRTDDGIVVTFENPITAAKKDELRRKFVQVMKTSKCEFKSTEQITFDFWKDGKIATLSSESTIVEDKKLRTIEKELEERKLTPSSSPKRVNYWKEFWVKLTTNGDAEDFFDNKKSKLNVRGAREVLATIRDVELKEITKGDPGIKYLKGLTQTEIEAALSHCELNVMWEIENKKSGAQILTKEVSPSLDTPAKDIYYVGVSLEGLPRIITDDDNTIHGIQSMVFQDVAVQRLIVLDDKNPPSLKVVFQKYITKKKIPQLARNLKNFLKTINVDEKALNNVTVTFLEEGWQQPPKSVPKQPQRGLAHRRMKTDDFLVAPGGRPDMTRSFVIKGIPEKYVHRESFLQDMPVMVFDGISLEAIFVPAAELQPDGSSSEARIEIRFEQAINIQRLPKIALKLKKFLQRKKIPPNVVNQVMLQVLHEEKHTPLSDLKANPVIGIIFAGIPSRILQRNESLYEMESNVFVKDHPIRLMEPTTDDQMLRITLENPIDYEQDLSTIAHRLKRFLKNKGVASETINNVLLMSFNRDNWKQNLSNEFSPGISSGCFIGIEIENMPASIVDSEKQLEEIERLVFVRQKVALMQVTGTTLRVTFGDTSDSYGMEKIARELRVLLSHMQIPINQINKIAVTPHTKDTWNQL